MNQEEWKAMAKTRCFANADFDNVFQARTAWEQGFDACWEVLHRKHIYWAAGETGCPRDIKASNGELHTLRCKVCGNNGSRPSFCIGTGEGDV